jgi:hypothetical protein
MKGIYFNTLKEMIHDYFDHKTYLDILQKLGFSEDIICSNSANLDNEFIDSLCAELRKKLKLSKDDFYSLYGDYYIGVYVKKYYNRIFKKAANVKEFLMKIKEIHKDILKELGTGVMPQIDINEVGSALQCKIKSKRNVHFIASMIKALGKIYKEMPVVEIKDYNKSELLIKLK